MIFIVGKITVKKPVSGKCVLMNTCTWIFLQHCIDHLYFWYHNMLLQLQHTCHKLLPYIVAENHITNWFIVSCDNSNECFHLLDSFKKWSVKHLCVSGFNFATLKDFSFEIWNWNCSDSVVLFVFVLLFDHTQYRPW